MAKVLITLDVTVALGGDQLLNMSVDVDLPVDVTLNDAAPLSITPEQYRRAIAEAIHQAADKIEEADHA